MRERSTRIMRMGLGGRLTLGIGIVASFVAPPVATAGGFRLFRHRSGYLMGAADPCTHGGSREGPYYGGAVYGFGGGGNGLDPYAEYARRDFDTRRDRLLEQASRIDVSFLRRETTGTTPSRTQPVDGGWVFLREGEAVKALGKFTARIMLAPGDAQARVGFALAAAMLDDERAAAQSMRTAVRFDDAVLREFESDEALDKAMRTLIAGLQPEDGVISADARFMIASLHGLLGEQEAGLLALEGLDADDRDSATETLGAMLADTPPTPTTTTAAVAAADAVTDADADADAAPTALASKTD